MTFGERVKHRREMLGKFSQDRLRKTLGYTNISTIIKVEGNIRGVPLEKVDQYAKALKTSGAYLMGWADNPDMTHDQMLALLNGSEVSSFIEDNPPETFSQLDVALSKLKNEFSLTDEAVQAISKFVKMTPKDQQPFINLMNIDNTRSYLNKGNNINERVRILRKSLNLSQVEFAKAIGVSRMTISFIEVQTQPVSDKIIFAICKTFNINPDWLRYGEGEMFTMATPESTTLKDEYDLTEDEYKFVKAYLNLPPDSRATCTDMWSRVIESE